MLVQQLLENSAARWPERIALVCGLRRLTYAELDARAGSIAAALAGAGIRRGDRVVLFTENSPELVIALFAVLKAGAIFSVLHPSMKSAKLSRVLADCRPVAVITDRQRAPLVCALAQPASSVRYLLVTDGESEAVGQFPGRIDSWASATNAGVVSPPGRVIDLDLATIIYTSGSTGVPKGVMSTHANVIAATTSINEYLRNCRDDVIVDFLPLSFDYGLYQIFLAFQAGASVVLERSFVFPADAIRLMRAECVTGFPGVPTIFSMLLQSREEPYDLPALRYLTNTAANLPVSHIQRLRRIFPGATLFSMYGLTECKRVSYLPPDQLDRRPDSIGVAIPNTEVYVVDEEGSTVPADTIGELVVRGSHVMRGYWGDRDASAARFRPGPLPGETVLHTGDLVRMDEEGFLYFVSRKDDIIKSRGQKVSPKEIEQVVYACSGVVDAAVLGMPDPVIGEAIRLVLALSAGSALTERDIRLHCQSHLEDFMVPRFIEIWPSLPKTPAGKIDKLAVRERRTAGVRPLQASPVSA
jgi:long-chain acyl-CoA synthetase